MGSSEKVFRIGLVAPGTRMATSLAQKSIALAQLLYGDRVELLYHPQCFRQSGHFDYDENLDAFYDYEKYGTERMNEEDGMFTDRGYIAYKGYISMEEVMNGSQSSHMEMGGMM